MTNRPRRMNIAVMRQILQNTPVDNDRNFFMTENFGVSISADEIFGAVMKNAVREPVLVEDYRVGMVLEGEIDATLNLIPTQMRKGNIIYLGRGTIAQIQKLSSDIKVRGFLITADFMSRVFEFQKPDLIDGTVLSHRFDTDEEDRAFFSNLVTTIWNLVHNTHYDERVLQGLLVAVFNYLDIKYRQTVAWKQEKQENSRNHELFNRFITLVNQHAAQERTLSYYANQLCLTPRYLGTVIGHYSGKTCKEWIDQATINHAKVLLRHTDKSVSQIADELKFPNDSFFCKYFRRLTGESPTEYRGR